MMISASTNEENTRKALMLALCEAIEDGEAPEDAVASFNSTFFEGKSVMAWPKGVSYETMRRAIRSYICEEDGITDGELQERIDQGYREFEERERRA
jgi:hypothetical protein